MADHPNVIVKPPFLALGAIAAAFVVDAVWPAAFLPDAVQYPVGIALFVAGGGLVAWAMRTFRRAGTNVAPWEPTLAIATEGPYRFARNPMYIGLCVAFLGIALAGDSLWAVATLIPVALVLHFGVVKREEAYLEAKFGEAYARYRGATRRWLW